MSTVETAAARPAVGIIGNSPPVEVIVACGAEPFLVRPDPHGMVDLAEPYLDRYIDPGVRNILHRAIRGDLEHLDLLVCDGADDRLYHFLNEVVRLGRGERIPPLYMYDLLQSGNPADGAYNLMHLRALIDRLHALTGFCPGPEDLAGAIEASNRARAVKRQVDQLRHGRPRLSGSVAASLLRATRGVNPATYGPALASAMEKLPLKPLTGPRLMLIPSTELHDARVHQLLEAAGSVVTVEDDLSGARGVNPDIASSGDPLEAIAERLHDDVAGSQMHPQEFRFAWTLQQMAAAHVDAVVFYIPPDDHDFGWSFPRLRAASERLGKPWLLIREDAYEARDHDVVQEKITQFVQSLSFVAAT